MKNRSLEELATALSRLHGAAGEPSIQEIGTKVGCGHTIVAQMFRADGCPSWPVLRTVVAYLGGDLGEFRSYWIAVRYAEDRVSEDSGAATIHPPQATDDTYRQLPLARPHPQGWPPSTDGRRNCGPLEAILWRQWPEALQPPVQVVVAIDRLAELPKRINERLANRLDEIFVGPGGVPELDHMTNLRGVPLPSGSETWDTCAGAYGEGKIIVGSRPSPNSDVMCHEVGHALDDIDSVPGRWQSDSAEFRMIYDQCQPHFMEDQYWVPDGFGRKEFFAEAFAAMASRQPFALVDILGGNRQEARRVMLYFNRRYGI
jgi:hypothetical protein